MSLRSELLRKRRSLADLPILPFLAPRAIALCPSTRRGAHSGTQSVQTPGTDFENFGTPRAHGGVGHSKGVFPGRLATNNEIGESRSQPSDFRKFAALWDESIKAKPAKAEDQTIDLSSEDVFLRKYEEIWNIAPVKTQQKNMAHLVGTPAEEPLPPHQVGTSDNSSKRTPWERLNGAMLPQGGRRQIRESRGSRVLSAHNESNHALLSYDREWANLFAMLSSHNPKHPKALRIYRVAGDSFPMGIKKNLIAHDSSATLRASWEKISISKRLRLWPELMYLSLSHHPESSLKVLAATYMEPYPPSRTVSDCINYIVSYYLRTQELTQPGQILKIFGTISYLLRNRQPNYLQLSQDSIYLLLTKLSGDLVKLLYDILEEVGHPLHQNTLIHFSSRLARLGDTDLALKVLKRIHEGGANFESAALSSLCSTVLENKWQSSNFEVSDSEIFEFMLKCGLKPNIITYNILLLNSFRNGDYATGWRIYETMLENGVKPDGHSYSILLNDAKLRMDQSAFKRVIEMIRESGTNNAHIATDILHAIFLLNHSGTGSLAAPESEGSVTSFERMLPVYCEYFEMRPLVELIPFFSTRFGDLTSCLDTDNSEIPMIPSGPTLVVMLTALLKECTPQSVIDQYKWFRHQVNSGNPVVVELLHSTHVYNIFLMAFGQSTTTLDLCPQIIGDMLSTSAKAFSSQTVTEGATPTPEAIYEADRRAAAYDAEHSSSHRNEKNASMLQSELTSKLSTSRNPIPTLSSPSSTPMPDVYTWSILLHIFMKHGQARAAEKVLTMMEARGVVPNQVTWNSLVAGYARMQDIGMTVGVIDRLEKAGFQADHFTKSGIAQIRDRRALIEAMKAKEDANDVANLEDRNKSSMTLSHLDHAIMIHGQLQEYLRDGRGRMFPVVKDI